MTLRIAMWCAPRTVSTALLRSFAQRADTTGVDEPLYAYYLRATGKTHPMREQVLAAQSQDWRAVVSQVLLGPCPTPVQFVKHMAHHLVGDIDLSFLDSADTAHGFLIRHPREMLPSLQRELGELAREDTGLARQVELLRRLQASSGRAPVVIDSGELVRHPAAILPALCRRLGLAFDPAMLAWEPGRHPCYGVWAPHWYANVEASTGFQARPPKSEPLPESLQPLLEWGTPLYEELAAERLRPAGEDGP